MLSGGDLLDLARIFGIKMKVDSYKEWLANGEDTILLYPWNGEENIGHWVAFFRNEEGNNYFDSYGSYPDELIVNGQTNPYEPKLAEYMLKNKEDIIYNDYPFQKEGNSCGVWCFLRILCKKLTASQFERGFRNFSGDEATDLLRELTEAKKKEINNV